MADAAWEKNVRKKNGKFVKTPLSDFETVRRNSV
jgi:hypothetical protein